MSGSIHETTTKLDTYDPFDPAVIANPFPH